MKLKDYIQEAILQIKVGINDFNQYSGNYKASYPDKVSFEIHIDEEGHIGGKNKVTMDILIALYPKEE